MRSTLKLALAAGTAMTCGAAAQAQFTMNNSVPGTFTELSTNPAATLLVPDNVDDGLAAFTSTVVNALVTNPNLFACTNGHINDTAGFAAYFNTALPAAGPNFALFAYWDDLYVDPANGTNANMYSLSTTEGGHAVQIIEWSSVQLYPGVSAPGSFEVKIWGAGGPALVQYLYQDVTWGGTNPNGSSATIGVQWGPGGFYQNSYNVANSAPNNSVLSVVSLGPTGACCFPDGTCIITDNSTCTAQGGTFSGVASACSGCPAAGACCVPTGTGCLTRTQAACTAAGGTWNGAGSSCGSVVCPGVYNEAGDAGEMPASAGLPSGTGGLFRINGTYSGANDVDMYLIRVCDTSTFSATTVGQTTNDTQLFLFTSGGMGVVFDDDEASGATLQSTITNAFVSSPGNYFLAVSGFNKDAVSLGGPIFPDVYPGEFGPTGAGGGSPILGWSGNTGNSGAYGVNLTGACFPNLSTTGACCRADGTCGVSGMQACFSSGGTYQGDGSVCGTCPQPGACCHNDGTCSFGQQSACLSSGGTFQGQSVACGSVVCPHIYSVDDGIAENAIGLTAGGAFCAANQFVSAAGMDKITHIRVAFGVPESLNGMPVTAYLWSDPNGDGNPTDAQVLTSATGVVAGAQGGVPITNPTWVDFDIPDFTIPIGQSFFVGFVMDQFAGQYPAAIDQTASQARSWVGYATAQGGFNPNAWTNVFLVDNLGFPGNWTIRADATAGNPNATGACCLTSGACTPSITFSSCAAQGGQWAGENVSCGTANCQPRGACCNADGSCSTNVAQNTCTGAGGTFRGAGSTCATPCPMPPHTWIESGGDAGDLPASAQVTQGADPLSLIRGTTGAGDPVDMFQIRICDVANFSAEACGTGFDTQMFLFNSAGMGVVADDDNCGLQSRVNGSTGCLSAAPTGVYYLAISGYDCDPSSSGGLIFDTNTVFGNIVCPTGPGAGQPVASWGAAGATGAYQIALTGACFSQPAGNTCYANCDGSTTPPVANVADFTCFLQKFAAHDAYANCDGSTTPPVHNVADFTCFLQKFAAGCP